jgi:ammonia channel protein AmtB
MTAYLCYSFVLTGFIYPVAARAIWSEYGFLSANAKDPFGKVRLLEHHKHLAGS